EPVYDDTARPQGSLAAPATTAPAPADGTDASSGDGTSTNSGPEEDSGPNNSDGSHGGRGSTGHEGSLSSGHGDGQDVSSDPTPGDHGDGQDATPATDGEDDTAATDGRPSPSSNVPKVDEAATGGGGRGEVGAAALCRRVRQ